MDFCRKGGIHIWSWPLKMENRWGWSMVRRCIHCGEIRGVS